MPTAYEGEVAESPKGAGLLMQGFRHCDQQATWRQACGSDRRYLDNHSEKLRQEKRVNLLEATEKHMKTNAFDPLSQRTLGSEGGGCHVSKGALSLKSQVRGPVSGGALSKHRPRTRGGDPHEG